MKTLSERNRILNEVKDSCYLAFFDGNPEEGGKEILTGRKKVNFPVATNGYAKSTNQLDFTGGEEDVVEYGETSQQTYSGKNLLKPYDQSGTVSVNGLTLTLNEGGSIAINGTSTAETYIEFGYAFSNGTQEKTSPLYSLDASSTYKLSSTYTGSISGGSNSPKIYVQYNSSYSEVSADFGSSVNVSNSNGIYRSWLRIYNGVTFDNVILYPLLELGSTVTNWEPYVGGHHCPNTAYPQDVVSLKIGNTEFCKITNSGGTVFKDSVYTENGKWYKHSEVEKKIFDGSSDENWEISDAVVNQGVKAYVCHNCFPQNTDWGWAGFCNRGTMIEREADWTTPTGKSDGIVGVITKNFYVKITESLAPNVSAFKAYAASNNFIVYVIRATATDEEITDQAIISALEEMFGSATGVAKYWGVYDSEVGGKLLYYFIMPYEVNIVEGSTVTINAGNCVLKEG